MPDPDRREVTELLNRAQSGDARAADRVMELLYAELRRIAGAQMRQRSGETLQPTALVNEAYLRMVDRDDPWESRAHFLSFAAKAMRSILVDAVRARRSQRRGGDRERQPLYEAVAWFEDQNIDLLALHEALDRLEERDPRKRQIVELRFFAGLTNDGVAEVLGVSRPTVERDWAMAKAWIFRDMG